MSFRCLAAKDNTLNHLLPARTRLQRRFSGLSLRFACFLTPLFFIIQSASMASTHDGSDAISIQKERTKTMMSKCFDLVGQDDVSRCIDSARTIHHESVRSLQKKYIDQHKPDLTSFRQQLGIE